MNRTGIAEVYANTLYHYQPDIQVGRWWVGGYPILVGGSVIDAVDALHILRDFEINKIVNVETEHDDCGKMPGEALLQIRVPDDGSPIPTENLAALFDFVRLPDGGVDSVYVHCQMGGSRSPAHAYAILRGVAHLSPADALDRLNDGFVLRSGVAGRYGTHPVHVAYIESVERALTELGIR